MVYFNKGINCFVDVFNGMCCWYLGMNMCLVFRYYWVWEVNNVYVFGY